MDYTALIVAILQAFNAYGPELIKSVTELIQGNPKQQGETDDAYVAPLYAQIESKALDTAAVDATVEAS